MPGHYSNSRMPKPKAPKIKKSAKQMRKETERLLAEKRKPKSKIR